MKTLSGGLAGILTGFAALTLHAEVRLAPLFTDHAVLQRDRPVPVWGTASPGEKVEVRFGGQAVSATTDSAGRWQAELAPLTASAQGSDLVVAGSTQIVLKDVVVGEVWLCSGQSNMEWPLKNAPDAASILPAAHHPLIRQFKVKNASLEKPAVTAEGHWAPCTPETAGAFTAAGYYFARTLENDLHVPIGLINSTWGGTRIEAWLSSEALEKFPDVAERWKTTLENLPEKQAAYEKARREFKAKAQAAKAAGQPFDARKYPKPPPGPGTKEAPAGLFNGMIAPLIPYAVRGMLWYQGEGNTGRAAEYTALQSTMIQDWRAKWNASELPFYWVQLPNYNLSFDKTGVQWAEFREAQKQVLALPQTGMAVTIDVGTPDNGHPPDKTQVGQRLARLAQVQIYQSANGDATGPLATAAVRDKGALRVSFQQAASGLEIRGETLKGFELAGPDGIFHPAEAQLDGEAIVIRSAAVSDPKTARYAWANNPAVSLFNKDGLPASPFVIEGK